MGDSSLGQEIEKGLASFSWLDPHTHLDALHLGARGLHDVLLYHMVLSDLKAAGMKNSARLSEHPEENEVSRRIEEALSLLDSIANTSCAWGVRLILEDLYSWRDPITAQNWRKIHDCIRERNDDRAWHREMMRRAGVAQAMTEWARRHDGSADDLFQYCHEMAFFSRAKGDIYDIPLRELEVATGREVRTVEEADQAMAAYLDLIPRDRVRATAQHLSTRISYLPVSREQMAKSLLRREQAGPEERDAYASYLVSLFLSGLQQLGSLVFQFSLAAEPAGEETYSLLHQETLTAIERFLQEFPGLHFQVFLASAHANQGICSLARLYSNLSVAGYWWHNFFPAFIEQVIDERLDMLPACKQIGFFSDAYCLEWQYAKAVMVRKLLARALARKVELGQYSMETALQTARQMLWEAPQTLLGMKA